MRETLMKRTFMDFRNLRGITTRRKIVVFESDDWGSIRMPDTKTYFGLLTKGVRVDNCPFMKYDSLATDQDLSLLFDVLDSYRDLRGNHPVFTANCVMANPNFNKIRESNFSQYHYELFSETLRRYPQCSSSFKLWNTGIKNKLFYPQFHGREHLNVTRWMKSLRANLPETRLAFDLNLFGISKTITSENRKSYLEAYSIDTRDDYDKIQSTVIEGLGLFRRVFGFSSDSFIAPNYVWPSAIENKLKEEGIRYIQGQRIQFSPDPLTGRIKTISHFTGQRNRFRQIYSVRNCAFEPSLNDKLDWVDECLAQVNSAFRCRKPAIITSHRLNFIGAIDPTNRERNLVKFNTLLKSILFKWPDVEFMTSPDLGKQIDLQLL